MFAPFDVKKICKTRRYKKRRYNVRREDIM